MSSQQIIDRALGKTSTDYREPRDAPAWRPQWNVNTFLVCDPKDTSLNVQVIAEAEFVGLPYAGFCAIQIWKSDHRDFPAHRFVLGALLPDGRFVPNFSPRVEGQRQGTPIFDIGVWDAMAALMRAAQVWQETDTAFHMDRYAERTSERKGGNSPARGVAVRSMGKTERERAKGKARPKRD